MIEESAANEPQRFQVLSRLGRGGMGTVYAVFDRVRGARMALKTVGPASGRTLLRFKREFRAVRELHHPNIVRLGELIELNGEWHYTMEIVDGVEFVEYVRTASRLTPPSHLTPTPSTTDTDLPKNAAEANLPHLSAESEARLRHALLQLVDALRYLHARGRVHRDVKPSNVLVSQEGRVVLLDFGLVRDESDGAEERDAAGTVAYMAPEQADHKPAAPEADFYALGVMLYEALTGTLPFVGEPIQVILQKSRGSFRSPDEVVGQLPKDLVSLCVRLLSPNPSERPSGAEIAELLAQSPESSRPEQSPALMPAVPFTGRAVFCAQLERAFSDVRAKEPRTVLLRAPSGFGKSTLLQHFLRQLSSAHAGQLLVLRGRCRPYEEVSFNALDAVVDALSGALPSWDKIRGVLSREQIGALQRAFPVLERVPGFGYVDIRRADARQLRLALHEGFRRIMRVLAATRHLVIAIDDVQWADDESWALLRELTREPRPPSILLILTARPEIDETMLANADAARVLTGPKTEVLDLPALNDAEARELVRSLAGSEATPSAIEALIREGRGNPLLLTTLMRKRVRGDSSDLRLSEVLRAEVRSQSEITQRVITATCLSGSPPDRLLLAQALKLDPAEVGYAVDAAIDSGLLRFAGTGALGPVEPYHDQLREAVCTALDPADRNAFHLSLAHVLSHERSADEQALYHYREAKDLPAVASCAERAGDNAMKALAFDRALRLYDEALLSSPPGKEGRELLRKRADTLSFAGRSEEAAQAYLTLLNGASKEESLELRRFAAAHFLSVGDVERGKRILAQVLADFGIGLPGSTATTLIRALWQRTRLRVRGMRVVLDGQKKPDAFTLAKLELCASCAYVFSVLDPILGTYFSTQHAVLALSAGDFEHALRAMSTEGGYRCLMGSVADGEKLMERAAEIASSNASAQLKATLSANEAAIAWARSDFRRALKAARHAQRVFSTQCQRVSWELVTLELVEVSSLFFLGQYLELQNRVPACLRASEQRGDRYGMTNMLVSQASARFLVNDDPNALRDALTLGMSTWPSSGFDMHHLMALQLRIYSHLYEEDREQALRCFADTERALNRSFLLRLTAYRTLARYIECQALLAHGGAALTARERRRALKITRELANLDQPLAKALGACAKLALDWSKLDAASQRKELEATLSRLESEALEGHAAALRLRASACDGFSHDEREELASVALRALLAQGVVNPQHFANILCPPLVSRALAKV